MMTAFTVTVLTAVAPALIATGETTPEPVGTPWMMCQQVTEQTAPASSEPFIETTDSDRPPLPTNEPGSERICVSAFDSRCTLQAPSSAITIQLQPAAPILRPSATLLWRLNVPLDQLTWVTADQTRAGYGREIDEPPRSPIS